MSEQNSVWILYNQHEHAILCFKTRALAHEFYEGVKSKYLEPFERIVRDNVPETFFVHKIVDDMQFYYNSKRVKTIGRYGTSFDNSVPAIMYMDNEIETDIDDTCIHVSLSENP